MFKSKVYNITDEEFSNLVSQSFSYSECLRKLDLETTGGSSTTTLKKRIKELNLSISHFDPFKNHKKIGQKKTLSEICIENSSYANTSSLKRRLVQENILEYKCNICSITNWNNMPLVLQLDHINGVNNDNRIENLRLLCPNCHSQTDTYAGKKLKKPKIKRKQPKPRPTKIVWPSKEELEILLTKNTFVSLGKLLGVSDNAVRKHCKKLELI
jgi:5-methylcytosine-specific restriction endonuclease McrA